MVQAQAYVVDGARPLGRLVAGDRGVLLEDVAARVAGRLEGGDRVGDRQVALAEWAEQAALHGMEQRQLTCGDTIRQGQVGVLQVHVAHLAGQVAGEGRRVEDRKSVV